MIWKLVPSLDGLYSVTEDGQVRAEERLVKRSGSKSRGNTQLRKQKIVKPFVHHGYANFATTLNGKRFIMLVHRAVYEAFIGELPDGNLEVVHHIDGNKLNNHVSNLKRISKQENVSHRYKDAYNRGYQAGYKKAMKELRR